MRRALSSVAIPRSGVGTTDPDEPLTLRKWRDARHWTVAQAALHLDVNPSTYHSIERGHQRPRAELLQLLADRTGVSKAVILGVADELPVRR